MIDVAHRPRAGRTAVTLCLVAVACAGPPQRGADSTPAKGAAPMDDTARLALLEREARALIRTTGCDAASSCRTAPVGWRACGGPRTYVVYCAASTDTTALMRKLEELKRAEMDYLERAGMASTCEMRLSPGVGIEAGSCVAR